eukprot:gnl/TRDRNA2_/TRDRNA2_38852_c0_seq1.p1 gnl/TRDRNA2_/TRDRNA2_38852_c0~~gnl/TRDRNA2_/TRDRNA2_38852_c0_seq1.p1  ORF type:complete len:241 (+),score=53.99 gnl/TRDRNA2_/TRDRNA2_38852_c0_seq1:48-770(+)
MGDPSLREKFLAQENDGMYGRTDLHMAARRGDTAAIEVLVLSGANINVQDMKRGYTPLHEAAWNGHAAAAEALIASGALVMVRDLRGYTPLHWATRNGHADVTEVLVMCDADIDAVAEQGITPLRFAESNGHTAIVQQLKRAVESAASGTECDLVATLSVAHMDGTSLVVSCTSIAGCELAAIELDPLRDFLPGLRAMLALQLRTQARLLQLVLPNGRLLGKLDSSTPLPELLQPDDAMT